MADSRVHQCAEYLEWMANSPFWAVKQYLLNRGFSIGEINAAAQLYVVKHGN